MTKHSCFPYTSIYSSMHHNTNRKHRINRTLYTNILQHSKAQNTIFNNGRYTQKHFHRPPHSHYIRHKTNMRNIHTSIVSRHLATRGKTKYCSHLYHKLADLKRYFPASLITPLSNSEQINHNSSNHTYTKSMPNHIHHHHSSSVTLTYTTHIISSTAPMYHIVTHRCVDGPRRGDCTAGQMDGEAGWWTASGKIGFPQLARTMEVARHQQQPYN